MTNEEKPSEGDTYECKRCGMAILVTTGCNCDTGDEAFFACCGKPLEKKSRAS